MRRSRQSLAEIEVRIARRAYALALEINRDQANRAARPPAVCPGCGGDLRVEAIADRDLKLLRFACLVGHDVYCEIQPDGGNSRGSGPVAPPESTAAPLVKPHSLIRKLGSKQISLDP